MAEVTRKMGISEQTFYHWKKKFGELMASEVEAPSTGRGERQVVDGHAIADH